MLRHNCSFAFTLALKSYFEPKIQLELKCHRNAFLSITFARGFLPRPGWVAMLGLPPWAYMYAGCFVVFVSLSWLFLIVLSFCFCSVPALCSRSWHGPSYVPSKRASLPNENLASPQAIYKLYIIYIMKLDYFRHR